MHENKLPVYRRLPRWTCAVMLVLGAIECFAESPQPVLTRAVVRSIADQHGKIYAYLKIMPHSKLPFTTQTLLVKDHSLVDGLMPGDEVGFAGEHLAGENTLIAIHKVSACQRFQPCPPPR